MKIVSPCHENYGNMSERKDGRHCSACEKTVIDFSKMNEDEISGYLKKSREENLCIRAKSYQLEDNTAFERFLLKLKQSVSLYISFTPLRIALIAMITGLLSFTSCYIMGKKASDTPIQYSPQNDSLKTDQKKK